MLHKGKLRPCPVTEMRSVPDHIGRPDYAQHPDGFPTSERAVRGSTSIQVHSDYMCSNTKFMNCPLSLLGFYKSVVPLDCTMSQ